MKKLLSLVALMGLSIALFVGVFSVVHRPLVVGAIERTLQAKLDFADRLPPGPKVVIFAGSNGRYSHRCEDFARVLARPCVNASMAVGLDLRFLFELWRPRLNAGDIVYMPLEYAQYRQTRAEMEGGLQNALLVHSQREALWQLPPQRIAAVYGSFELPFLVHGLVEMVLARRGFLRRVEGESSTPEGDSVGHSATLAAGYTDFVRRMKPERSAVPEQGDALEAIGTMLRQARAAGVQVVGGLPTLPEGTPLEAADLARIERLYTDHGQAFLALPNRSLHPFDCFYDTVYHLHEGCQRRHSVAVAEALAMAIAPPPDTGAGRAP
jgi:hypothetical protein